MPAKRALVIDAGTSALRAVAVDARGNAERIVEAPWPIERPNDASEYARELDGRATGEALERIMAVVGEGAYDVIAVAGQREGVVFADGDGTPLLVSPNIDARAAAEGMAIDAADGAGVYQRTGRLPSLLMAPAKLRWLRVHRPKDAERVASVLPLADWLASRLTGELAASRSLMCEIGLMRLDGTPNECDVELPCMATVAEGSVVGTASFRGQRTPVVLAGADTQCGVLGASALEAGETAVVAGWSAPVQQVGADALLDGERRTWTGLHVVPGRWVLESNAGDIGRGWAWVCEMLGVTAGEADELAASAQAGSRDAMMVLARAPMNAAAMTAGVGAITFPLPLAMSTLDRADVLRATLESAAYAIRANVEQVEEVSAERIDVLRLGGGMSRSTLFAQMLADVLDRPIEVARSPETTALGAAMLAFVALGVYSTIDEAAQAMAQPRTVVTPNARDSATYDDCYARWRMLAAHMEQAP